jgi:hypothetical protein
MTGCSFHTTCIEFARLFECDENCYANTLNLKWLVIRAALLINRLTYCSFSTNAVYPYCMSYLYTDIGYSILDCDEYADVVTLMGETYAGEISYSAALPTITAEQTINTGIVDVTSASQSINTDIVYVTSTSYPGQQSITSLFTSVSSPSSSGVDTSNGFSSASGTVQNSSSHLGAIIGGIVGGLVVIGNAAGIAVWFCSRRMKRNRQNKPPPQAPPPMKTYQNSTQQPYVASNFSNPTVSSPTITSPALSHAGLAPSQQNPYPFPQQNNNYTHEMYQNNPPPPQQVAFPSNAYLNNGMATQSHTMPPEMAAQSQAMPPEMAAQSHAMPPEMDGRYQGYHAYGGHGNGSQPPIEMPG